MDNQNNQNNQNNKNDQSAKGAKVAIIIFFIFFFMVFGGVFISIFSSVDSKEVFIPVIFVVFFVFIFATALTKTLKSVDLTVKTFGTTMTNGDGKNIVVAKDKLFEIITSMFEEGKEIAIDGVKYTVCKDGMLKDAHGTLYDSKTLPAPVKGYGYDLSYALDNVVNNNPKFAPAVIPAFYLIPPDQILKNMINTEINNRGFSGTIPKMEKKKNILSIIFAFIILIETVLIFFHPINLFFNLFLIIITFIVWLVVMKKMNITNIISKEVKARPDEDIKMVIASILDDKVSSKKLLRIGMFVVAIIIPCLIFMKPRMIYEKNDIGGYSLRYYTIGLINDDVVEIPDKHDGLDVNEIRGETFKNVLTIDEVKLPSKLQEIRGNTFQYSSIKKITIPDGVTRIGGHAFEGCRNLSEVVIPESVKEIGSSAFRNCDKLYTVTISSDCTVNTRAFKDSPTTIKRYGSENNSYNDYNY